LRQSEVKIDYIFGGVWWTNWN